MTLPLMSTLTPGALPRNTENGAGAVRVCFSPARTRPFTRVLPLASSTRAHDVMLKRSVRLAVPTDATAGAVPGAAARGATGAGAAGTAGFACVAAAGTTGVGTEAEAGAGAGATTADGTAGTAAGVA